MAIRKRQRSNSGFYHVVVKGINKENLFEQQREKAYFRKIIYEGLKKYKVEIYAYCIMSNHAHFLIWAEILEELSQFMARILAKYALYYNFKHNRNGHVFQNRFTSENIENEGYFWNCIRYIHLNPVKAKMLKKAVGYRYSSMGEYCTEASVLICGKAFEMYKKRFLCYSDFEEFHLIRQRQIFVDTADEVEIQRLEIACTIAEEVFYEKGLSVLAQVFEEKEIREDFIRRIQKTLKISKRKAREICIMVKNKTDNE